MEKFWLITLIAVLIIDGVFIIIHHKKKEFDRFVKKNCFHCEYSFFCDFSKGMCEKWKE